VTAKDLSIVAGCEDIVQFFMTKYKEQPKWSILDYAFNRDSGQPTGTGSLTLLLEEEILKKALKFEEYYIKEGWIFPDGSNNIMTTVNGFIKDVSGGNDELTLDICDKGVLMEQTATVSFTDMKRSDICREIIKKAGLNPFVDFTGIADDKITYNSASKGASGDGVSGIGARSCAKDSENIKEGKWYQTSVKNYCPSCDKTGTLVWGKATNPKERIHPCGRAEDPGIVEGHFFCCQNKGGCDADYSIEGWNHGWERGGKFLKQLTILSGPTEVSEDGGPAPEEKSTTTDPGSEELTEAGESTGDSASIKTKEDEGKSFWDMIQEVCQPVESELQMFVWLDTFFVRPIPKKSDCNLFVDETENLIADSFNFKEGNPNVINTLQVNYGSGKIPGSVTVQDKYLADKYGILATNPYNMTNLNKKEALNFGWKELARLQRDSGFNIDFAVIGHPEYDINRWCGLNIPMEGWSNEILYITRIAKKFGADQELTYDISVGDMKPTLNVTEESASTGSLEGILDKASKYKYCKGTSTASAMEQKGCGDCWAMSEYIYNQLSMANIKSRVVQYVTTMSGRHQSVQLFNNGEWTDLNYDNYKFDYRFKATDNKPGMIIVRGG
jgi:hypothetical protein